MRPFRVHQNFIWRSLLVAAVCLVLLPSLSSGQYWYQYKITDSRDGKLYKTVHIDDKWWMAENLNYGTRIDNILEQGNNSMAEKYCYYNNETYCTTHGGLYQWDELMQYGNVEFNRGLCPSGWHVSSDDEWKQLETFLGMDPVSLNDTGDRGDTEGGMLKSQGLTRWSSPNADATDTYGFSALPGGFRDTTGNNYWLGLAAYFWNADAFNGSPWLRGLGNSYGKLYRSYKDKRFGVSVRCIKDSKYMFGRSSYTDPRDGKNYATVLIANHWWMAENLNVGTRIDHNLEQPDNNSIQKYCYNDNEAYCDTFGGLYQWDEVMQFTAGDKQGICPDGWHVPTDADWMALEWAAGMGENDINLNEWRGAQGLFLQPEGGSGFDALLGGANYADKIMSEYDTSAYFWTSSEGVSYQKAWMRGLYTGSYDMYRSGDYYKKNGYSVRCVRNENEIVSLSVESEDTVCSGQETTLRARTYGGTEEKYYYWWSEPDGFYSTDSVVQVTPAEGTTFFVRIIDGYVYIRDSVSWFIRPAPDFEFMGDTTVCPSDEQLEYGATDNSQYTYSWGDTDGTLVSSDENHAVISWGTTPGYKYIEVTATDKVNGCSASDTLWVNVLESPKPEIKLKGELLLICTDSGYSYQWYLDDAKIKNATRQFYYVNSNESGSYAVEIKWDNQCISVSDPKNFREKSTGDAGENGSQTIFISPNPTNGYITLDMICDFIGPVKISITSIAGRLMKQYRLNKYNAIYSTDLDLGQLTEGSYLMAVEYGTENEIHRLTIK